LRSTASSGASGSTRSSIPALDRQPNPRAPVPLAVSGCSRVTLLYIALPSYTPESPCVPIPFAPPFERSASYHHESVLQHRSGTTGRQSKWVISYRARPAERHHLSVVLGLDPVRKGLCRNSAAMQRKCVRALTPTFCTRGGNCRSMRGSRRWAPGGRGRSGERIAWARPPVPGAG